MGINQIVYNWFKWIIIIIEAIELSNDTIPTDDDDNNDQIEKKKRQRE